MVNGRSRRGALASTAAVLSGTLAILFWAAPGQADRPAVAAGQAVVHSGDARASATSLRLVTAPTGNEARYRVREQLARLEFPNDAVGSTESIRGTLVLNDDGTVDRTQSRFTIDLATIRSDNDRRDNYVRRNTLRTAQHPEAVFAPTSFAGLPWPLPSSGQYTVRITGDLTINGVTRASTWDATIRQDAGGFRGSASTEFTFADHGMAIPRVAAVLSVTDRIRLEYDMHLVPGEDR
jgi:polyisoprenoid-binding protein YceI